ncbi:hypothetical protein [Streptomyces bauhiniae]|uniref:hypothetical protein n=1 Tax=Streptomyces bauhiniae TaxID=2340725 RepID=UPI00142EADA0|nr:hypothetical protein [Streptomyces bauhiniae]
MLAATAGTMSHCLNPPKPSQSEHREVLVEPHRRVRDKDDWAMLPDLTQKADDSFVRPEAGFGERLGQRVSVTQRNMGSEAMHDRLGPLISGDLPEQQGQVVLRRESDSRRDALRQARCLLQACHLDGVIEADHPVEVTQDGIEGEVTGAYRGIHTA